MTVTVGTPPQEAIFRVEGNRAITGLNAAGPWSPDMQHGSAPTALVTFVAEAMPAPVPMQIARITVDLMRPVPLVPLDIETKVLRQGRNIQLCEVRLKTDDVLVVQGTVLKIRTEAMTDLPPETAEPPVEIASPDRSFVEPTGDLRNSFVAGLSVRSARGRFGEPAGPGAIWYRVDRPLIEGAPTSQVMRAAVASDFCNATSVALDFRHWTFLNADLTISLSRAPVGEWILLDGESWIGADGAGLAAARLGDERGYFGRAIQTLVVARR